MRASVLYWQAKDSINYRLNLAEQFTNTHERAKMYDQAFGICQAYLDVLRMMKNRTAEQYYDRLANDWIEYRNKFENMIYLFD